MAEKIRMSMAQNHWKAIENMVQVEELLIDAELHRFLIEEALPGSGVNEADFWVGLSRLVHDKTGQNRDLLARRILFQTQLDEWHRTHQGQRYEVDEYKAFLEEIGYLNRDQPEMLIRTEGIDPEIAQCAGPQLIVPITNARYAVNAVNARWGSLYDALYGTDALGSAPGDELYDPQRGAQVIAWAREFLDSVAPLNVGSHSQVIRYLAVDGGLHAELGNGLASTLSDPSLFVGFRGDAKNPRSILLRHHGLHIELVIDRTHIVGELDRAGVADVVIESALTTIIDCEDSVAVVDAADKVHMYRNWLGLMKGDLEETFTKAGEWVTRRLADEREFLSPDGGILKLPGRAILMLRIVGHLMTTDAVIDRDGNEVPEGLLDAMVTVLISLHDLRRPSGRRNSRYGSIYIVKPKMHGPEEVAFADDVFTQIEEILGLPQGTVKLGIMDEERRTSVNLALCINAASSRIAFINTGFLDRTGDEIHTSMEAGVMARKGEMKHQSWFTAYEERNVDIGLACGLPGRAQIGKGMWAAPDLMAQMLHEKIGHPQAGATCAWVPSPTAATLHATHYHRVDVHAQQDHLMGRHRKKVDDELVIPIVGDRTYSRTEIVDELENNAQGILGYVVRWVDQGIGCSKVPDIHNAFLMEDRATCRISSQHIANWLRHGILDHDQVMATMKRMATKVDGQNAGDPAYLPMSPAFDGDAFKAACDLVFKGADQPSGYTELILHEYRRQFKQRDEHQQ
jgi:malate synthase